MNTPQSGTWGGARPLMRQLRGLMRGGGSTQERLDRVASLVADDMVAEVCSIYVQRAGEVLELFATKGLKPEAVHATMLRLGEGIIGDIASKARPLRLADAQGHPNFAYRPETGEEIYRSMLGVPILRAGRVLGVLAVQNKTQRNYSEEEEEALETIAMVLAEIVSAAGIVTADEERGRESSGTMPARLTGLVLHEGLAMGAAVLHERGLVITRVVADDTAAELKRLDEALQDMLSHLDDLVAGSGLSGSGEYQEVLEAYRMFAQDRGWLERIREAIKGGLTAEAATQRVNTDTQARFERVKDPYIRERYADLKDLGDRLLQHLLKPDSQPQKHKLPQEAVVIARTLGPAELLDYDTDSLCAVVLEEGSPTSHVSIVARALGVPVVGRCSGLLGRVRAGDFVVVDGDNGQVMIRPRQSIRDYFQQAIDVRSARKALFQRLRTMPSVTKDGVEVSLHINAGLLVDVPQIADVGAEGIGLYRTEVPFMVRHAYPDVEAQQSLYARIYQLAEGRPVVFRTLDIGGDKPLPYWQVDEEENPAMGWRAIRVGLDRPSLLRGQIRALLRAAAGRELRVMFPMISDVWEFRQAKALLHKELEVHNEQGRPEPRQLQIGAMLEVPGLAWQLPALLREVDFLSLGTNDFFQFFFATDRGNPRLARRYDTLSPGSLAFLRQLSEQSLAAGVPVTVCGEMAGNPLEAMALVGCGLRRLSMSPPSVGPVKNMVRSLELAPLEQFAEHLSRGADHSVRAVMRAYAQDRDIAI